MNNQAAQTMPAFEFTIPGLIKHWREQAEECRAIADRIGVNGPAYNELLRDASQYVQSAYQLEHIAALSQTAGVAEGYAVVPIEPTGDMLDAILAPWLIGTKTQRECLTEGYRAMIVAAQSNDYASRCDTRDTYGAQPGSPEFDGADAFERYLRQTTQAAQAASGVDTSTNEAWAARAQEKIAAMDAASGGEDRLTRAEAIAEFRSRTAASVSERARALLADAYRTIGYEQTAQKVLEGAWDQHPSMFALAQALTQQRGSVSYNAGMAMHWIDRYAAGIDEECQLDRIAESFPTTPQPGAEALREGVAALAEKYRNEGAGYRSGGLVRVCQEHADELESLLARGVTNG